MQELRAQPEQMTTVEGDSSPEPSEQLSTAEEHSPSEPEASTPRAQAFPGS